MKSLFYVLLGFVFFIQIGCDNKQQNENNKDIIGIWQNTSQPMSSIEFTENGYYYLRIDGKRLVNTDTIRFKYIYNSSLKEKNLKIFDSLKCDTMVGKLVVINPNRIKFSIINKDKVVSESEFTKLKQ